MPKRTMIGFMLYALTASALTGCAFNPDPPSETLERASKVVQPGMSKMVAVESLHNIGYGCALWAGHRLDCVERINVFPLTTCSQGVTVILDEQDQNVVRLDERSASCFGGFG